MISYIVLPLITPLLSLGTLVGPLVGLVIGIVALGANFFSIYRFSASRHRYRKPVIALHCAVIVLLSVLLYRDIAALI